MIPNMSIVAIAFTRGRTNNSGSAQIYGRLYADGDSTYDPGPNVIIHDQHGYYDDEDYYGGWS